MNRSITGAWSQHHSTRRGNKISLNSPLPATPPPPGSAAAAALRALEVGPDGGAATGQEASAAEGQGVNGVMASASGSIDGLDTAAEQGPSSSTPRTREASPATLARASTSATPLASSSSTSGKRKEARTPTSTSASSKRSRKALTDPSAIAEKYAPPSTSLADLGGIASSIEKVLELIALPLRHGGVYHYIGMTPPRGVLLHGPPGCGKTMLAGAIANYCDVPFLSISAPSIVSGTSGESEATLRQTFEEAARIAPCILFIDEIDSITPKRETAGREMERRIVAQLLTCLDDLSWDKTGGKAVMVIGATNRPDAIDAALRRAGRFDHEIALGVPDEAGREQILRVLAKKLRLSGDFDFKALAKATPGYVGADLNALTGAAGILAVKRIFSEFGQMPVQLGLLDGGGGEVAAGEASNADVEMGEGEAEAPMTNGNNPEQEAKDTSTTTTATPATPATPATTTESQVNGAVALPPRPTRSLDPLPPALSQSPIAAFLLSHPNPLTEEQLAPLSITNGDFLAALPTVQPSSKREGFATVPDVSWGDVGALHATREELNMAIVEPIRRPDLFASVGVQASSGVLLWGPPGCGKTLLAKAVANESRANFISVKGPELLNKYVGESERAVRQVFSRARTSSPCVIFFDELDALVPRRDDSLSESSSRVVNTLLTELDGLESRGQVYVIGATNRPDMIDPAMCRPGRLDKLLYVDLPTKEERGEILKTITAKMPLQRNGAGGDEAMLGRLAEDARMQGFSGADLANLAREAAVGALKEALRSSRQKLNGTSIDGQHFEPARGLAEGGLGGGLQVVITETHFLEALDKVSPSVSVQQRAKYAQLRSRLSGNPAGKGRKAEVNGTQLPNGVGGTDAAESGAERGGEGAAMAT
ncbi:AAA-domain-containing protein [Microstroma glucosiphilum]|uniref:AAA-domain-containing protein n=1 Tax=Pseudomicrostroma glucosiphilum TaxID=1684307 RepID=A0A316U1D6_9BASI|nr:AAA-domain-containing protein [Pseudomicrostroma glucosiphilum]PWN19107.1 AAA-domain-containing protein [Pseudomicrostroma glucosiphilum]